MKRAIYISILLIVILSLSSVVTAQEVMAKELTLEEVLKLAITNSRQSAIDDLEIIAKETALREAREDADMAGDKSGSEDVIYNRIKIEISAIEAEVALETAKITKTDNIKKLKLDATKAFYDILLTQKELEKETEKLKIAGEKLGIEKARYNTEMITAEDYELAQYNFNMKTIEVETIREKLKTLDLNLKNLLNLPFDTDQLMLKGSIELVSFEDVDINNVAARYLETNTAVLSAAGKYDAAKRMMEQTEKFLRKGSDLYDDNRVSLEKALRDYETAKRNAEVNIRNIYNDLISLSDKVELALKYEELQLKKLSITKIKYDKGQIGADNYITTQEQYLDAVYDKYRSIYEFNMKYNEFLNMTLAE